MNKQMLQAMMHSPVHNYIVPGLTSWLIGNPSAAGTIRMFTCSRDQQESVTPHSHRFDFQCKVLAGKVTNKLWTCAYDSGADDYAVSILNYEGDCGKYTKEHFNYQKFRIDERVYADGDWYSMKHDQIHSIHFSRGAEVIFLEGPTKSDTSKILQPYVGGETVPTFKVEPWMFKREAA